jgi:hypothetical protein
MGLTNRDRTGKLTHAARQFAHNRKQQNFRGSLRHLTYVTFSPRFEAKASLVGSPFSEVLPTQIEHAAGK